MNKLLGAFSIIFVLSVMITVGYQVSIFKRNPHNCQPGMIVERSKEDSRSLVCSWPKSQEPDALSSDATHCIPPAVKVIDPDHPENFACVYHPEILPLKEVSPGVYVPRLPKDKNVSIDKKGKITSNPTMPNPDTMKSGTWVNPGVKLGTVLPPDSQHTEANKINEQWRCVEGTSMGVDGVCRRDKPADSVVINVPNGECICKEKNTSSSLPIPNPPK